MSLLRHRRLLLKLDWGMLLAILALLVMGVLFIYSAGFRTVASEHADLYKKQIMWLIIGLFAFFGAALYDYRDLRGLAMPLYVGAIFLLVLVLTPLGTELNNSRRWLNVGFMMQPSEIAKIALILALATYLSHGGRTLKEGGNVLAVTGLILLPFLLIAVEPDLGTAAVLVPAAVMMLMIAGLPLRLLAILMSLGFFVLTPITWLFLLRPYHLKRFRVMLDPSADPQGAGWNVIQSRLAIGSGGLHGKGWNQGTQSKLDYLPRDVAPNDFIFSVIGEEKGFIGSCIVISLYCLLIYGMTRAAVRSPDRFGRLIAFGFLGLLFTHVFVNIAMTVSLMPVIGLPLPLLSYGGSFLVCTMVALGITQSIYIRRQER